MFLSIEAGVRRGVGEANLRAAAVALARVAAAGKRAADDAGARCHERGQDGDDAAEHCMTNLEQAMTHGEVWVGSLEVAATAEGR